MLIEMCFDNTADKYSSIKRNVLKQVVKKAINDKYIDNSENLNLIIQMLVSCQKSGSRNREDTIKTKKSKTVNNANFNSYDQNSRIIRLIEELRLFKQRLEINRENSISKKD